MMLTKASLYTRVAGFFSKRPAIVGLSVVTGLLVVLVYSLLELLFFSSGDRSLMEILFLDVSAQEILVRSIVTLAFLAFGLFAAQTISQVRQTRQALSFSEARFETIANYTPSWENWVDSEGRLLWVSQAVEKLTGYTAEEVLAKPGFPTVYMVEEDRDRAVRVFGQAVEGSTGREEIYRMVRKDGSVFWASVSWQPLFDEDGHRLGHRSSIRDISKRQAVTEALRHAVEGTAAEGGRDFFKNLTRYLASALNSRVVVLGEAVSEASGYWTMALWDRDAKDKQASLDLDTATYRLLSERTAGRQVVDIEQVLPKEHLLRRRDFKSCLGAPLPGDEGKQAGVLLVLDDQPMDSQRAALAGSLINIFASRAGAELQRQRAEDELRRR